MIKNVIIWITTTFIACNLTLAQGHRIEVEINGLRDTSIILGHYFNKGMYVDDTIRINNKGYGILSGTKKLEQGLYIIYFPDKSYFDLLIGEDQVFKLKTTATQSLHNLMIEGAEETKAFTTYQRFLIEKQALAESLRKQRENIKDKTDSLAIIDQKIQQLNLEVKAYWDNAIKNHKGTFFEVFLKAIQEVELPEFKTEQNTANPDSILGWKRYFYVKDHYFDNIDLTDARILRTPFFAHKIDGYFNHTLLQIPDSLSAAAIQLIEKTKSNPEVFRFMVQYLFNYANDSKLMGMDAMLVALGEKYYLSGDATWANEEFLKNLRERVAKMKPNLVGKTAPDLLLQSYTGEFFRLSEVNAPITILTFWEPSCGHCKHEMPLLKKEVWEKYKNKGIRIFAIYTHVDKEPWVQFIEEHHLNEWIHVYDPYQQTRFRDLYDIFSTPVIYVLDKDKKIIAKRIGIDNLPGFMEHLINTGQL
jgi:thiol-disulfide isomerase/thioredoxin